MSVDVMLRNKSSELRTCRKETPVMDCIRLMNEYKIGALVVTGTTGRLDGIITERDILRVVDKHKGLPAYLVVSDIMTPAEKVITTQKKQTIEEVMEIMTTKRIRHMPVVEDNNLIAIISIGDVIKFSHEKALSENTSMKNYISGV